jgi:hypothetical protein
VILHPRALPYRDFSVVWTFSPVRQEVLDAVPDALLQVLGEPAASGIRLLMARRTPESFADRAVERTAEVLSTDDAIHRLRYAVRPRDPLRILLSHERITFAVSHAMIDGLGIAVLIAAVMAVANGERPQLDERPPVRFPLLTGLRQVGLAGVRSFLAQRHDAAALPAGPHLTRAEAPDRGRAMELRVDPGLFSRIEHLPTTGRSTPAARLASVAVEALARVHRGDAEIPVFVPVSLLRHVGNRRVVGNFIGIEPLGALHSSDWSPAAITARLATTTTSGRALVGLAYVVLRELRHAVLHRPLAARHGRVAVSMQMLRLPNLVPLTAWASEDWTTCAATVGPWPSSTALAPSRVGKRWVISAWDESGQFDLDAFPAALLAEIAAREAAASRSPA